MVSKSFSTFYLRFKMVHCDFLFKPSNISLHFYKICEQQQLPLQSNFFVYRTVIKSYFATNKKISRYLNHFLAFISAFNFAMNLHYLFYIVFLKDRYKLNQN